ncbi:hypothetical protein [Hymenobacter rubripertinctus]|uniref:DUF1772 domain-containing protein n=1 Tax=Hymenobacter rubripertinctus TaxID=2029981 RepID=A0A418QXS9_9BACT|nr:hypothetical protein [Hymenobacter rubripertinctus]RIY09996.1 hypothetical protein D0T11_10630 [Hymenobacter rubripertinctus]
MTLPHLLLLNFGLAAYLTGLIWTVQLVHYPGFARVEPAQFEQFHREHSTRISWVVMAPMLLELGAAGYLAWQGEALGPAMRWGQLALVLLVWASTFFITVPFHNRLARGYNYVAIDGLVRTNWPRTLAWTARAGWLGWVLWSL